MTSERESILLKIRKLLAVGQSTGSEAESQNALAHAERLMAKYNISLASVEAAEIDAGDYIEESIYNGKRLCWEQPFVLNVVEEFFFCKVIIVSKLDSRRRVCAKAVQLFGDAHNVEIGRYVFVFLSRTFRDLWAVARKQYDLEKRHARTFYLGLRVGFSKRLRDERQRAERETATNGLIVVGRRLEQAFEKEYGELPTSCGSPIATDASALGLGIEKGKSITLRDAIKHSAAETARIV